MKLKADTNLPMSIATTCIYVGLANKIYGYSCCWYWIINSNCDLLCENIVTIWQVKRACSTREHITA